MSNYNKPNAPPPHYGLSVPPPYQQYPPPPPPPVQVVYLQPPPPPPPVNCGSDLQTIICPHCHNTIHTEMKLKSKKNKHWKHKSSK